MSKDVTLFLTACGRPDLLFHTLQSFVKYNTYPIKQAIIMEDSGQKGIDDFAYNILPCPCTILYNETRVGQMKSIANGLQFLTTPYVFHCEDDWEFYNYGFIEKSFEILDKDPTITSVWLRSHDEMTGRYGIPLTKSNLGNYYYTGEKDKSGNLSFNPGLRTIEVAKAFTPYTNDDDEGTLSLKFRAIGMKGAMTDNPAGYVRHIGWGRHVSNVCITGNE